jgi:preprotein translocase subunit SecD
LVFTNDATAEINNGNWVVNVGLQDGPAGADLWNALTTKCFNRDAVCPTGQIAIVLDGKVISAPVVQEAVFSGGTVQISGDFTEGEARDLAKILEFGAVPVKFAVATVQTVSPTLGEDSLRAAIISGLVGVLLVVLFFECVDEISDFRNKIRVAEKMHNGHENQKEILSNCVSYKIFNCLTTEMCRG